MTSKKSKQCRRSRFRRAPTGKRILLTERDYQILRWLYRYRFLRSTQLIKFIKPKSQKRFIERLGDLYHETGMIDRPNGQWRNCNARYNPIVYELSGKGQRWLEHQGELPGRVTSLARRNRPGATPQFDHAMMIVDTLAEIELETIGLEHQRFVSVDEILARAPKATQVLTKPLSISVSLHPTDFPRLQLRVEMKIVPDGLYGIEHHDGDKKHYEFFALECENRSPKRRSTACLSSLELKQAAYQAIIQTKQHRTIWGLPCLSLHIVNQR